MVLPPTVLGYYLLILLGQRGIGPWIEHFLGFRLVFTLNGAVIAGAITAFPLVVQSVRAGLLSINPEIENAARLDGCSEWAMLWRVSLPLAWPSILAGAILGFLRALGDFGTMLMVAGNIPGRTQTMAMAIYDAVQANNTAYANRLTFTLTAVAFGLLFLALRISRRALDIYQT
jgi:molybdate transport system permease protein